VLVWFLLGYLLWACLYAMAGAIVSRQEDLQSSTTVLTLVLVVSYLVAFPALDDPSGGSSRVTITPAAIAASTLSSLTAARVSATPAKRRTSTRASKAGAPARAAWAIATASGP
jgi:ABC-type Na+ efflux pump permease subunit